VSHGFKPKAKAGNKGKVWIPSVFEHAAGIVEQHETMHVSYYQRPEWTFHAKGMWLTQGCGLGQKSLPMNDADDLLAVSFGSGNYGARSYQRDVESNLYMILPPQSPFVDIQKDEWNRFCQYSSREQEMNRHPSWIKPVFPVIRSFF
jgi:hypothetical protein